MRTKTRAEVIDDFYRELEEAHAAHEDRARRRQRIYRAVCASVCGMILAGVVLLLLVFMLAPLVVRFMR